MASAAAVPCMLMARRPSQATVPGSPLLAENSPPDCFFTLRPSRVQDPLEIKKSRCCDSYFWCERRDLPSAAAVPCMLMARRPSQATVPGSPLLAENSPPDCFFTLRPSRVQDPLEIKKSRCCDSYFWCERRDLNPYGITTRPSNVRVCRFRHSRIQLSFPQGTLDIISDSFLFVNCF